MAREEALSLTDNPIGFPPHPMRVPKGKGFGSRTCDPANCIVFLALLAGAGSTLLYRRGKAFHFF
jgi:hypothetical protein